LTSFAIHAFADGRADDASETCTKKHALDCPGREVTMICGDDDDDHDHDDDDDDDDDADGGGGAV
jgi:hypothetical protein